MGSRVKIKDPVRPGEFTWVSERVFDPRVMERVEEEESFAEDRDWINPDFEDRDDKDDD